MSSSLSRGKRVYLTPKNIALFEAYTKAECLGDSEALNEMVKQFFQSFSETKRRQYLNGDKEKLQVSWPL